MAVRDPFEPRRRAYSLIEVLVALLLLTIVLTGTITMFVRATEIERRADAQLSVLRALEAEHEALRAGRPFPKADGRYTVAAVLPPGSSVEDFEMVLEVAVIDPNGIYGVTLDATYRLGPRTFRRLLEVRVWRP
ncbi:MAG: type II secretion system protein [Acidobacteriota bacterium]